MGRESWSKVVGIGALTGLVAALLMTVTISALRYFLGLASPPELLGDRIAPLIGPHKFVELLSSYGSFNALKQAGVRGVLIGQLAVGALGGVLYAVIVDRERRRGMSLAPESAGEATARPPTFLARLGLSPRGLTFAAAFAGAIWLVSVIALWPALDAHYGGLPPTSARLATLAGLLVSYGSFGVAIVLLHRAMTTRGRAGSGAEVAGESSGMLSGRRAALVGGAGAVALGLIADWLVRRKLYDLATFSYDGLQYLGPDVQPITPNDRFYAVTKNVIDPRVNKSLWRLEVTGLVAQPQTFRFAEITALPAVTQETTLMCISFAVGGGLMSNAAWKGVPMRRLIEAAKPRPGVVEVLLHAADGYTDTFSIEKAMDETTLVVYEMNGEPLPERHGYPVRVVVPGLYGEKNVKWVTRIELVGHDARGLYEQQGWGPDFRTETHSRIDGPDLTRPLKAGAPVMLKGIAYGGDAQGVSKVEVSLDDGQTWQEAEIEYPGSKIAWALWGYAWTPERPGEYQLVARATDGAGRPQTAEERGAIPEGSTGLHHVAARVEA